MTAPPGSEPNSRPPVRSRTRPEQWRPIPYFEGVYEISSLGRVKRVAPEPKARAGRLLTSWRKTPNGRPVVGLHRERSILAFVDALVEQVCQHAVPDMAAALVRKHDLWLLTGAPRPSERLDGETFPGPHPLPAGSPARPPSAPRSRRGRHARP